jgi:hypothetical protein
MSPLSHLDATAASLAGMPERLDRVQIELASQPDPIVISWAAREELLARLDGLPAHARVIDAFRNVGATAPVQLDQEGKLLLSTAIDDWLIELRDRGPLPAGIWDLRTALLDSLRAHNTPISRLES